MLKTSFLFVVAAVLLAGCASEPTVAQDGSFGPMQDLVGKEMRNRKGKELPASSGSQEGAQPTLASSQETPPQLPPLALQRREVIRTASLELRVDDIEADERRVNAIVSDLGGYIENVVSSDLAGNAATISITARIPVARFEEGISRFESLGVRLSKTIAAEDVTAQTVDLDARLKTMRAQEDTVRQMLKGIRDMNQVLELQNRLTALRSEIESIQSRRSVLGGQASLSTVTVGLKQSSAKLAVNPTTDANWFAQARGEAAGAAMGAFQSVVTILLWLAFFSPIWLAAVLVGWWFSRSVRNARKASSDPAPQAF